jgi:hypothetical protein
MKTSRKCILRNRLPRRGTPGGEKGSGCGTRGVSARLIQSDAQKIPFDTNSLGTCLELAMESLGRNRWAIAEGYIPSQSSFTDPALVSHETACILNAGDRTAHVRITIFFADREPVGPYLVAVGARRTLHLKFNDLNDPQPVPRDTAYSSVFESDVPIVVQHTRLDSRHAEVSLLSSTAYAEA